MRSTFLPAVIFTMLASRCWGLGEETVGNKPLPAANYSQWRGIMPLVNHEDRVYRVWVNGNELIYGQSSAATINGLLKSFAAMEQPVHEVLLRPGVGETSSFGKRKFEFNWQLQMLGGIAGVMLRYDKGELVWPRHPQLTIYVDEDFDLKSLKIPANVQPLSVAELSARYRKALASTHKTVRGWTNGQLARLDPFNDANFKAVAEMIRADDDWVKLNAVGALAVYGRKAKAALPTLRKLAETTDPQLKKRALETIEAIEDAPDNSDIEKGRRATSKRIDAFLARVRKSIGTP